MAETLTSRIERVETLKTTIVLLLDKVDEQLRSIEKLKARIERLEAQQAPPRGMTYWRNWPLGPTP